MPETALWPYIVVLGTAQDAGYPAAGCSGECCRRVWAYPALRRFAACLGIVDPQAGQCWLIDCTPDFREQLQLMHSVAGLTPAPQLSGIFLTHAHMGHYTGLIHLGKEAMAADGLAVHAMPGMQRFIESNSPWDLLVQGGHIELHGLAAGQRVQLGERLAITPVPVPHRDERSETVGFEVRGPERSALYIPDIDRWAGWDRDIADEIGRVDLALLDGTFYDGSELPGRDMSLIPHPPVADTLGLLAQLPAAERGRVRFFHFNHTNPVIDTGSDERRRVASAGFGIADEGWAFRL